MKWSHFAILTISGHILILTDLFSFDVIAHNGMPNSDLCFNSLSDPKLLPRV